LEGEVTITEKDEALALPLAKKRRALLPVEEMLPEEILAFCPACKTLEVIRFSREGLIATRKFAQRADKVYHCCGSSAACRLHGPAGHTGPDATGKVNAKSLFRPSPWRPLIRAMNGGLA
jgi:hypothetical protein